ncbi:[FeFe] hydrogenase H-cluster radical SAM maturase HydG [Eubacterium multiforme]|uniref:2-iminoacetate synthase n=1 Tax=Eubacterium multiforme TaxID=83339 RepID=A0ABT9UTE1_9FIRM|nr:[FeFe] hydrogenase H-cluster radical SAM maturase HydG [Eubacterium multiforme]MDQ0149570.1 2-iminoacetate synthase [Eubacterium multiforme]
MFINHELINGILEETKNPSKEEAREAIEKAKRRETLSYKDIAILLATKDKEVEKEIFKLAGEIKESIYGKRIVLFAPLYISDYCVNNCIYCGYHKCNDFKRKKLTQEEIAEEVRLLEKMGHKRLALELGEDPENAPIEYVVDSLKTIYNTQQDNGEIRRVNVNIAATTEENYKKLKDVGIGTYVLFQETYNKPIYERVHPNSIKGDYEYHLTSFDRAMDAGIEDVGAGVLFGLADPRFEVLGLMMHNAHLEEKYGVGFHTISVPRLRKAKGVTMEEFPYLLTDEMFKRVVAVLRIAVPFTGMIITEREPGEIRREALKYGISQISSGSSTVVGGYKKRALNLNDDEQFKLFDADSSVQIIKDLLEDGYIPSYCTACYRKGRTGDRFMSLAKSGEIQNVCEPNAISTLVEFSLDYGDEDLKEKALKTAVKIASEIKNEKTRAITLKNIERLKNGERDLFL